MVFEKAARGPPQTADKPRLFSGGVFYFGQEEIRENENYESC
jgi:hypothetical protein